MVVKTKKQGRLVSEDLIIFSHIPKTAGLTVRKIIESNFDKNARFAFRKSDSFSANIKDWIANFNSVKRNESSEELKSRRIIEGHIGFGIHKHLVLESCTYMTVMRHPVDRLNSHFYYLTRPGSDCKNIKQFNSLNDFIYCYRQEKESKEVSPIPLGMSQMMIIDNLQTRFLSGLGWESEIINQQLYGCRARYTKCTKEMLDLAKHNLDKYIIYGVLDRFKESLELFENAFEWRNINFENKVNVNKSKPSNKEIDPDLLEFVLQENKFDMELYNYALNTFDQQLEKLQVAPKIITSQDIIMHQNASVHEIHKSKEINRSTIMETKAKMKVDLEKASQAKMQEADKNFTAKNYPEAIIKYKEVVEVNPNYIPALNKLASSFQQTDAEEQATMILKRVVKLNPSNDRAYAKIARLQAKKGEIQNAIFGYKKAISINYDQPDWVFIGLGRALRLLKQSDAN